MGASLGVEPENRHGLLRIGSLSFRVTSDRPHDVALLAYIFKQRIQPFDDATDPDVALAVGTADAPAPVNPTDRLFIAEQSDGGLTLGTDLVEARLDTRQQPVRLTLSIRPNDYPEPSFCTHLSVVMNRVLLALGRAYVHSAAVAFRGRRYLFVGDKAAGKSTICLALGRLGGEILSDDHVLVGRRGATYFVSGCEETSRVTPRTEEYIFGSLDVEAQDFGGLVKKEFMLNRFFRLSAYQDFPIDRIFFSRVGQTLRTARMSRQAAAIELIEKSRALYRFTDAADLAVFLDFWTMLAAVVPAYSLELSPELSDLERLPALLEA